MIFWDKEDSDRRIWFTHQEKMSQSSFLCQCQPTCQSCWQILLRSFFPLGTKVIYRRRRQGNLPQNQGRVVYHSKLLLFLKRWRERRSRWEQRITEGKRFSQTAHFPPFLVFLPVSIPLSLFYRHPTDGFLLDRRSECLQESSAGCESHPVFKSV